MCILLNEKFCISAKISLNFVPKGSIDNDPALIQIMAWHRKGDKPLSEPMLTWFIDVYAALGEDELKHFDGATTHLFNHVSYEWRNNSSVLDNIETNDSSVWHSSCCYLIWTTHHLIHNYIYVSYIWMACCLTRMASVPLLWWASYQIRKIAGCTCAGNAGNVSPHRRLQKKPIVSDPGMHHGTCVTHVPWCMSGSLTLGGGENVPGIPGACAPAILRIWQEVHHMDD